MLVASVLSVSLGLACAIVSLLISLGYAASATVIAASLGVGAALAAAIAVLASAIIARVKKNGLWNTVYW